MIKIVYGDDSRIEKTKSLLKDRAFKSFDSENLESFHNECFSQSLFGGQPVLLLKRAENIKDLSFLAKIPKNREVILEAFDEKGEFIKKIKEDVEKIEARLQEKDKIKEIIEKLKANREDAKKLSDIMIDNFHNEIVKLENYFFDKEFNLEEAEKLIISEQNIEIFKALEALLKNNNKLSLQYAEKEDALPFIYAFLAVIKVLVKIKVLDIKKQSYDNFMKKTYPKFKKVLPHPYFVFKNISIASKYSLKELYSILKIISEAEEDIRTGDADKKIALLNMLSKIKIN